MDLVDEGDLIELSPSASPQRGGFTDLVDLKPTRRDLADLIDLNPTQGDQGHFVQYNSTAENVEKLDSDADTKSGLESAAFQRRWGTQIFEDLIDLSPTLNNSAGGYTSDTGKDLANSRVRGLIQFGSFRGEGRVKSNETEELPVSSAGPAEANTEELNSHLYKAFVSLPPTESSDHSSSIRSVSLSSCRTPDLSHPTQSSPTVGDSVTVEVDASTEPIPTTKTKDSSGDLELPVATCGIKDPSELEPEPDIELDDEDKYRLVSGPVPARKISERKRIDTATFENWLKLEGNIKPAKLQRMEVRERAGRVPKNENRMTTAALIEQSQLRRIVDTPREYQIQLFEKARERNTIIVLDTGSGKTLIAMLLLRHTIEQELGRRAAGQEPKISFFIVETVGLVDQQWSALRANLPYPVARLFGGELEDKWNSEFWNKTFEENKIVVCTAAILQKALLHSFIMIKQINLLIIDEAHHAKKNHPYARIIKDYYLKETKIENRPRILGMTASPVDGKGDIETSAEQLEGLLQSQIATVSTGKLNAELGIKVSEEITHVYNPLKGRSKTKLVEMLEPLIKWNPMFNKHADFSEVCTRELGPWCTDRFWKLCFSDKKMGQLLAKAEAVAQQTYGQIPFLPEGKDPVGAVHDIREIVRSSPLKPLQKTELDLSYKLLRLITTLEDYFAKPNDHKCIVFVERRLTAVMLVDVCGQLGHLFPYLKAAYLIGTASDMSLASMTYADAVLSIHGFRGGETNCLFASSIAEEGIDIPGCDVVIRFDLCNSLIQYIQSKGRARHEASKFINMLEEGNIKQAAKLEQVTCDSSLLRDFCSRLPESRLLDKDQSHSISWKGDLGFQAYTVEETGATLTLAQSLDVLDAFAASFQEPGGPPIIPQYAIMKVGTAWVAQVNLPEKCPIQCKRGQEQKTKQAAKCSAAFEMCIDLIRRQFIDGRLQPYVKKKLPAMRNARLAVSANKTAQYNMLLKPGLWARLGQPNRLHGVSLVLSAPGAIGRPTTPLILLTRQKLPDLPVIPLFFGAGRKSLAKVTPIHGSMEISDIEDKRVEALVEFTLRIFKDAFNKAFEATADEIPYFLAPSRLPHEAFFQAQDLQDTIDWGVIQVIKDNKKFELGEHDDPDVFYKDRYILDPYCGSRSFYSIKVRPDLKPCDQIPEGVPPPKVRKWASYEHTIKEWSISLWSGSRDLTEWDMDQPVVEVELVSLRRNMLDDFDNEEKPAICYVIMQPLEISALPVSVVAMAFTFPAIIHRIDSVLLALEASSKLGLQVRSDLALEAVTKDSDNSDEHGEEKVNFQAGMGKNYERLEFLGDAFLKMATSIALFTQCPEKDEFAYHVERMLLICNKNMFNTAVDMGLQEYVRSKSFNRRTWFPTGLRLMKGKAGLEADKHSLSDKSVADVCEAFIGAAYLSYADDVIDGDCTRMPDFDMAVKAVSAVVKNKKHKMEKWSDYYAAYKIPDWQASEPTPTQVEAARIVGPKVGYEFKYPALLRSAFKHPSYPYEKVPNYQRLEFLGDSILDMVCVDFLFKKFPEADPQWLTEHKMAMVSNQFLGCLCVELGLHRHLLSIHATLLSSIRAYVELLERAQKEAIKTAHANGKETYDRSFWLNASQPPKCLPDIVEAYVGAMFVDSGYDYTTARRFFESHIRPYFEDMTLYDSFANRHPMTYMASRLAREYRCKEWRVLVKESPPDPDKAGVGCLTQTEVAAGVLIHGKVFVAAKAASGRYAKVAAAKEALGTLDEMEPGEFKEKFGCDCILDGDEGVVVLSEQHGTAI
ncbi:hypothetical protein jhhlp_004393 [Lomentospora prolificans]|uniref:Dicer-like protein 1 n=1 Tax=Lomentospora prolificans TaxID=41688 RepID=A0A2N3NBM0_9PEZI|nr:hypothetical protein jhhlp_004393 [Lomentospora prolificans]